MTAMACVGAAFKSHLARKATDSLAGTFEESARDQIHRPASGWGAARTPFDERLTRTTGASILTGADPVICQTLSTNCSAVNRLARGPRYSYLPPSAAAA